MKDKQTIAAVRGWVNAFVVDMNLCPFAKRELMAKRVRFAVTQAATEEQLLQALQEELELLNGDQSVETTLLIHPQVLNDFHDYNQFLDLADALLVEGGLEGVYQIASFHPGYQFGGTEPEDAENYTNRSPFPVLHILREETVERVVADYADVEQIPARNTELMNSLGKEKLKAMLQTCFDSVADVQQF